MSSQVSSSSRQSLNARQAETVERLMVAGLAELGAVGHEALTVRSVATRAGVSPATAYTYLASKNHLFAELFWRFLVEDPPVEPTTADPVERLQRVTRRLVERLAQAPHLAAAVTPALLGTDPDVERLRVKIGHEFVSRFHSALGPDADPHLLEAVTLAFFGALLQGGMGLMTYAEMADQLQAVVAVILKGHDL
ncbi:TetR/AcrR family transcriptional regulator [Nocardioides salsibiostraticola]